jgi:RNA polymerase sigma factor (sigma-70 family)
LSLERPSMNRDRREEFLALAGELRPDLHRYCARLMGSVIDGEDVVQDTLIRAFVAFQDLEEAPPLRPWLFRIAHNRALDLLRSREVRMAEPIDAAADVADSAQPDPLETLMRKEAVKTAVSRFVELPSLQRRVVILDRRWSLGKPLVPPKTSNHDRNQRLAPRSALVWTSKNAEAARGGSEARERLHFGLSHRKCLIQRRSNNRESSDAGFDKGFFSLGSIANAKHHPPI